MSRTTYIRWEQGTQKPQDLLLTWACNAFNMTAEQLGFVAWPGQETEQQGMVTASMSDQVEEAEQSSLLIRLTREQVAVLLSILEDGTMTHFDPAKRETLETLRKLLAAAGVAIIGAQLDPDPWEQLERVAVALKRPSRIDIKTLNGLRDTTENHWQIQRYGSVASPDLLNSLLGHLRIIKQLLHGSHLPSMRAHLCATASETGQLAGMLLVDMNCHDAAQTYYKFALERAQEANDDTLYAAALGRMSTVSAAIGKPREALPLLQEARLLAAPGDAFTLRSWLAAEEAEAQAELKDADTCSRALEDVERFVGQIQQGERTYGTYFDGSRLIAYRGACFMRLGQPDVATPALLEGLKNQSEPADAFTRAILLDLATASYQAGEIEQACSYIHQSLDIITQTHAVRYLQRVYKLRRQLEPWAMVQDVKDLDKRLRRLSKNNGAAR